MTGRRPHRRHGNTCSKRVVVSRKQTASAPQDGNSSLWIQRVAIDSAFTSGRSSSTIGHQCFLSRMMVSLPSRPAQSLLTSWSLAAGAEALAARDRHLASIYKLHGVPPMWGRRPGFPTLLRIVLEQQVSLISARAMFARLKSNIDPFTAEGFIRFGEGNLRLLGVTRQKAHYCVQVAHAFTNGDLKRIGRLSDDEAHAALVQIKGVGPWTANIYLLMALRRPDIWPDGDIALATAVGRIRKMKNRPSFPELARVAERWRPYRSVAARMLWQYYLAERDGSKSVN
jgi:DNA-3-methyladenine glycosylase II